MELSLGIGLYKVIPLRIQMLGCIVTVSTVIKGLHVSEIDGGF
jgi:hypothetical protein